MNLLERLYLRIVRRRSHSHCGPVEVVLAVCDIGELKGFCLPCLLKRNGPYQALLRIS